MISFIVLTWPRKFLIPSYIAVAILIIRNMVIATINKAYIRFVEVSLSELAVIVICVAVLVALVVGGENFDLQGWCPLWKPGRSRRNSGASEADAQNLDGEDSRSTTPNAGV